MAWPEGWKRQDIGSFPGATDGNQHVWIDQGLIKTFGAARVPVKVVSILLAAMEEEPDTAMWDAYVITWTEYERGWGQRPDGISLHETPDDADRYVEEYWKRVKAYNKSKGITGVPDEYSKPDGEPSPVLVGAKLLHEIRQETHGIRLSKVRYHELQADPLVFKKL